jgi:hypothetical protein
LGGTDLQDSDDSRRENAEVYPSVTVIHRHCEERSDEAIHTYFAARWIASLTLAMTVSLFETVDQKPNKLTVVARDPRRVSANRSPPLVAELP